MTRSHNLIICHAKDLDPFHLVVLVMPGFFDLSKWLIGFVCVLFVWELGVIIPVYMRGA